LSTIQSSVDQEILVLQIRSFSLSTDFVCEEEEEEEEAAEELFHSIHCARV
jgi:hypothetical protein